MKLSKKTLDILKAYSAINTNLVIKPGSKISTMSAAKDIMSEVDVTENFDKKISIFNLNEFLGVVSAFADPEFELEDNWVTVKEGKQKVKYVYADESLLTTPTKSITMPKAEISFLLDADQLAKAQKMAGILAVDDLAIIGDGKNITIRILDLKNPTGNNFDIDLETPTKETFECHFKVDKLKLMPGDHDVEISSKKISKFANKDYGSTTYIAVEATSTFN